MVLAIEEVGNARFILPGQYLRSGCATFRQCQFQRARPCGLDTITVGTIKDFSGHAGVLQSRPLTFRLGFDFLKVLVAFAVFAEHRRLSSLPHLHREL